MRTSKAGSSPFLCHALCNSPRFVFHKCIPKLSRWIRSFSFFPLFLFPCKKKPWVLHLVLRFAQRFDSVNIFMSPSAAGQRLRGFVWPCYFSEPEHEVSSSSSVASIPREKCTFKTNKRPSRVTAKELRGQLSSKFQTIIRFYGTLCN